MNAPGSRAATNMSRGQAASRQIDLLQVGQDVTATEWIVMLFHGPLFHDIDRPAEKLL